MKITYKRRHKHYKQGASIEVIGAHIEALKKRNATKENPEGWTTKEEILESARPEDSPIHNCVTWDVAVATLNWQLRECSRLQNCYQIHIERTDKQPVVISPANVRIIRQSDKKPMFVSSTMAMKSELYGPQVLKETMAAIQGYQNRLRGLRGLNAEILQTIEHLLRLIAVELQKAADGPKKGDPTPEEIRKAAEKIRKEKARNERADARL